MGFPDSASGKEPACQLRRHKRHGSDPWVGKIPWKRTWQLTAVFLPGKLDGQRSLAGYSPWGRKESDTTEATRHAHMLKSVYVWSVSSASWTTASTSPNIQVQDPLPTNLLTQKGQTPPLSSSEPHSIWGRSTPGSKLKEGEEETRTGWWMTLHIGWFYHIPTRKELIILSKDVNEPCKQKLPQQNHRHLN